MAKERSYPQIRHAALGSRAWIPALTKASCTCFEEGDYLLQADNIVFDTNGGKIKREGHEYHDCGSHHQHAQLSLVGMTIGLASPTSRPRKIVVCDNQATSKMWFQSAGRWCLDRACQRRYGHGSDCRLSRVAYEVFNDDLIIAVTDSNAAGRSPLQMEQPRSR
jgi:hypothetical protein